MVLIPVLCPLCGHNKISKRGKTENRKQRYFCQHPECSVKTSLLASLSTDMNLGFWCEIHVWNTTALNFQATGKVGDEVQRPLDPRQGFAPAQQFQRDIDRR